MCTGILKYKVHFCRALCASDAARVWGDNCVEQRTAAAAIRTEADELSTALIPTRLRGAQACLSLHTVRAWLRFWLI